MMPTNVLHDQLLDKLRNYKYYNYLVNIITYIYEWFENIAISRTLKKSQNLSFACKTEDFLNEQFHHF